MALDIEKKKKAAQENERVQKSKGVNAVLWLLVTLLVIVAAVGNVVLVSQYSTAVRVVGIVLLLVIAFALAALTNQGVKARAFLSESRVELRRIVWPTRPEATQTTFIIMGVTVLTSLILWGLDSVIVVMLRFLTDLRF